MLLLKYKGFCIIILITNCWVHVQNSMKTHQLYYQHTVTLFKCDLMLQDLQKGVTSNSLNLKDHDLAIEQQIELKLFPAIKLC